MARAFSANVSVAVHVSAATELCVVTYPQALLATAKSLIADGQCGIAIVVAHMACEVAVERALSAAFAAKGVAYLEEAVADLLNGDNLAADRNRKLYVALTGDAVEEQAFWSRFKESARRRNKVVHEGRIVGTTEAEASLDAAAALIAHLKQ